MIQFGPRYYFGLITSFFAQYTSISAVFLAMTWVSLLGVNLATYWAARRVLRSEFPAALVACVLVMAVASFNFGDSCYLRQSFLHSRLPALPLELFALGASILGAPILLVVFAVIGGALHPSGVITGALGLMVVFSSVSLTIYRDGGRISASTAKSIVRLSLAVCLFAGCVYFLWLRRQSTTIDGGLLVHIYAYYRCPHHYLASSFSRSDWTELLCFLAAFVALWRYWMIDMSPDRLVSFRVIALYAFVMALCAGGFVFIEMAPNRHWVSINAYRSLYAVKWLGFLLLANVAVNLVKPARVGGGPMGTALLLGNGGLQPYTMLGGCAAEACRRILVRSGMARSALCLGWLWFFVAASAALALGHREEWGGLLLYGAIALWFIRVKQRAWRFAVPLLVLCALLSALMAARTYDLPLLSAALAKYQPVLSFEEDEDHAVKLGGWARVAVPEDAVFVVPPELGKFRLISERAIVVDVKGLPTQDAAVLEWYTRLQACYGSPTIGEEAPMSQLGINYSRISGDRLEALAKRYGATHAVLYQNTQTKFPELYRSSGYKIVQLSPESPNDDDGPR